MINRIPNQNKQINFKSLNAHGNFLPEEMETVVKPVREFAKSKFENFGEIHVELFKPLKQGGFFQGIKDYSHNYEINISPMGINSKPEYNFSAVTSNLSKLGKELKNSLDESLKYIEIRYKIQNKIAPKVSSEKNMQQAIDLCSSDGANEIYFA